MTLCRKTRILLLLISLVPMVIGVGFQRYSTWKLGRRLADGTRDALAENAEALLLTLVTDYQKMVERDIEKMEMVVRLQAREAERLLSQTPGSGDVFFAEAFDSRNPSLHLVESKRHGTAVSDGSQTTSWVSFQEAVTFLVDGSSPKEVKDDVRRLAPLVDTYRTLFRPEDMVWQYTALELGIHVSYPGHGGYPEGYDPRKRAWYQRAKESGGISWQILPDATTRKLTPVVSIPVRRPDGSFAGVSAIDVPMDSVFEGLDFPQAWADHAKAMLVMSQEVTGDLLILAKSSEKSRSHHWEEQIVFEALESDDQNAFETLKQNISAGKSGVSIMGFKGQESLWAYACGEVQIVVVVPYDRVIAQALVAREYVLERTIRGLQYSGLFFVAVFVFIFFLSLKLARKITSPVRQLAEASTQLAKGAFDVRVDIHTGDEFQHLGEIFNQTGPMLRERERMKQSLHLANEIQQNLLPSTPPTIPGFQIVGKSVYCEETGGDYYDFIDMVALDRARIGIAVGDVSGHGIGAALLMASARAVLRSNAAYLGDKPEELFASLNRHLSQDTASNQFMTLFLGILDASQRCLTWVSGGHDPALLIRAESGEIEYLENTGMAMGIVEDATFTRGGPVALHSGDVVFIGTDGIWESRNPDGTFFGKDRLEELLRAHTEQSAEMLHETVVQAVQSHVGSGPQDDDITLVVFKAL